MRKRAGKCVGKRVGEHLRKKRTLKTYAKQVCYSVRQAIGKGVRQGVGKGVGICCGRIVVERVGEGGSKRLGENVCNVIGTRAGEPVCKPLADKKSHSSQLDKTTADTGSKLSRRKFGEPVAVGQAR